MHLKYFLNGSFIAEWNEMVQLKLMVFIFKNIHIHWFFTKKIFCLRHSNVILTFVYLFSSLLLRQLNSNANKMKHKIEFLWTDFRDGKPITIESLYSKFISYLRFISFRWPIHSLVSTTKHHSPSSVPPKPPPNKQKNKMN